MATPISKLGLIFTIVLLVACSKTETINGFDQICLIYTEVLTDAKYTALTPEEKATLIKDKIIETITSIDAIETYSSIAIVDPAKKYTLFKESAEYSLKRPWDCPIMDDTKNYPKS